MAEENKQEQQVVEEIVEEKYIENPHKWTLMKYFKSIARFKWWVIGFSLFGALAGYLGFMFILNPLKKNLVAAYTYDLAGTYNDTESIRFIDGTLFNPHDLTKRENLQKVKDSNKKYSQIDIDKIIDNGAIVIEKKITYYNDTDTDNLKINYSISAKAKYFPNDNLGKDFVYDLINLAKELSTIAISNYNTASFFTDNFATITFEKEINQLLNQYTVNNDIYITLINTFGNSVIANEDGAKLYQLQNAYISNYYTSSVQSFITELQSELKNKKYVNYVSGQEEASIANLRIQCENYIQEIEDLNRKIVVYQNSLDKLVATTTEYRDDIAKEIASLTETITNFKLQIDELEDVLEDNGYYLDKDPASPTYMEYIFDASDENSTIYKLSHLSEDWINGCNDFKTKINNYKERLELDRQKTTEVFQYCFSQYQNKVNIENGGYVTLEGKIYNFIGAIAGLALGFVITSLITATIYIYKEEK